MLPPSLIESQIRRSESILLTGRISNIYVTCPKEKRIADYLVSRTARVNYSVTLNNLKINEISEAGIIKWVVESPKNIISNGGSNLIDEEEHCKFNNKLLVLMNASVQKEHYKKEREYAEDIARDKARHRIRKDKNLQEVIKSQMKLKALGSIYQVNGMILSYG